MRAELLTVLRSLSDEVWDTPTACPGWSVRDVALHILSDDLGFLSRHRDHDGITFAEDNWATLVKRINEHNDLWVRAGRRLSRVLLLELLEFSGLRFQQYVAGLDTNQDAGTVAWAGTEEVPMWLQIAREYTEHWLHHQHICEAVGRWSLKDRRFLYPVIATYVYALPHTYHNVRAPERTVVELHVTGDASGRWYLQREEEQWTLYARVEEQPVVTVSMSDDTAWRLFTKGLRRDEAVERVRIQGQRELGEPILDTVAIIA
jgi:uncharacterized protein (TIGR03083 family)